jgi:hypothetical protein
MSDWLIGAVIVLLVFLLTGPDCPADGLDDLPWQPMINEHEPPRYNYDYDPCAPDAFSAPKEKVHKNDIAIPEPSPFYLLLAGSVVFMGWRRR